uniref:Protein kinase domain-containing protein n=1 Tax=Meloidogyne enterolobii TaxID=390850 RepID=A0A6V7U852_MELEN|nr:unnamed protein product [Meloidogyne enterolobii]
MADGKKDDDGKKGGGERSVIKDDGGKGPQAVQGREQQQQEDANTNTEMISRLEPMEAIALDIGTVVSSEGHRKWHVLSRLGAGAFGAVYLVEEEGAKKEEKYALKAERLSAQVQMLAVEVQVYQALMAKAGTTQGKRRYPLLIDKGAWNNQCNYLVMSLVGPSLEDLRRKRPNNRFSMGTALIAAKKTLAAIVQMHLVGFLHRDVNQASKLLDWTHGQECHLHPRLWHGAMFCSARRRPQASTRRQHRFPRDSQIRLEDWSQTQGLCRGDDVESWFYMACELVKGKLPWQRVDEEAKIRDMKIEALRPGKVDVKGKGPTSETAAETKTKSEAKPKAESKPKTETKTKTEAKPKSEAKPKTETKTKAEANPKSEPKTKVEPKAKAAAEGKEGSAKKAEREPKDPRRLLLGGCPKQFANILELVAPLRYYDDPPYDDIAELIATALRKMNVQTYPLDWQEGGNKA